MEQALRAAIEAKMSKVEVTVIGKRVKEDVYTLLAAGSINAAFGHVDPGDSWQQHFADTMDGRQPSIFLENYWNSCHCYLLPTSGNK